MRWRLLSIGLAAVFVASFGFAGVAVAGSDDCAGWFPATEWTPAGSSGPARLVTAGLDPAPAERFRNDVADLIAAVTPGLELPSEITVCVFSGDIELDPSGLLPEHQRLHGVFWAADAVVVVDAQQPRFVRAGLAYALTHVALWETARNLSLDGYPALLGEAVAQYYAGLLDRRTETHRATMRRAMIIADPNTDRPPTPWTAGDAQPTRVVWNPEFQESPIGDIVRFALETRGPEVLRVPTAGTWDAVDLEWRRALRFELLGDESGAVSWRWGLGILVLILATAGIVAWLKRRERRRFRYQPGTRPPIPGLFEE